MSRKFWSILIVALILVGLQPALAAPPSQTDEEFTVIPISDDFQAFWPKTDFTRSLVAVEEIFSGGVQRDQIPPYYPPGYVYPEGIPQLEGLPARFSVEFTDVETTNSYLPDEAPVISVVVDGEAQAYPLILLNSHEVANSEIAGIPIVVTFCPLCNAAIVFDARVEGETHHFGVSGFLINSDLVMWDHESQTWWQQFTGQGIIGQFAGTQLNFLPSLVVSWGDFKAEHPDGKVLVNQGGDDPNRPAYQGYEADDPFLFFGEVDDRLESTDRVLGYFGPEGAIGYPFGKLAEVGVINDQIGGVPSVAIWQSGAVSVFSPDLETGGAALYEAQLEDGTALTFVLEGDVVKDEQTGSSWNVFGRATEGELEGSQLEQYNAFPHFWFAWQAFRPDTLLWEDGLIADIAWAN